MESLQIYELFIRPLEGIEVRIEEQCVKIVFALIRALFICTAMSREHFSYGHFKAILFSIHFFQRRRNSLASIKLLNILSASYFVLLKLDYFSVAYISLVYLFLDSEHCFVMDAMFWECILSFVLRYVIQAPDTLILSISAVGIFVYYYLENKIYVVDFILLCLLYNFLTFGAKVAPFNDTSIFYLFVMTNTWMLFQPGRI